MIIDGGHLISFIQTDELRDTKNYNCKGVSVAYKEVIAETERDTPTSFFNTKKIKQNGKIIRLQI